MNTTNNEINKFEELEKLLWFIRSNAEKLFIENKMGYKVYETQTYKFLESDNYNFVFNKHNGMFVRWGKDFEEDPQYSPFGPEILDLEISSGKCMGACPECYKGNGNVANTFNMTLDEFKQIVDKVSSKQTLTQIALGLCDIGTNPDLWEMMRYSRSKGIIPNYTCHGLDMNPEYAKLTAELAGAVAVSVYNKEKSYNAVKMLADAGMKQINFHCIAHDKSYDKIISIVDDITTDPRLKSVNALVLLRYKPKGNGIGKFHNLTVEQYKHIIEYAEQKGVALGFDSCTAPIYLEAIKEHPQKDLLSMFAEPCESGVFSSYINCKGIFYACSFCENEGMWKEGINVFECIDFTKDVWYNEKVEQFRTILSKNCRNCPMFKFGGKDEN